MHGTHLTYLNFLWYPLPWMCKSGTVRASTVPILLAATKERLIFCKVMAVPKLFVLR